MKNYTTQTFGDEKQFKVLVPLVEIMNNDLSTKEANYVSRFIHKMNVTLIAINKLENIDKTFKKYLLKLSKTDFDKKCKYYVSVKIRSFMLNFIKAKFLYEINK